MNVDFDDSEEDSIHFNQFQNVQNVINSFNEFQFILLNLNKNKNAIAK